MKRFVSTAAAVLFLLPLAESGVGCKDQTATDSRSLERTTPVAQKESPASSPQSKPPDRPAPENDNADLQRKLLQESWFALYMGDAKIGHGRNRVTSISRAGETLLVIDNEQQISIHRNGDRVDQIIRTRSLERPDGDVLELKSEISGSGSPLVTRAVRNGDQLDVTLTTGGKTTSTSVAWQPQWRGFDAEQQILRSKVP